MLYEECEGNNNLDKESQTVQEVKEDGLVKFFKECFEKDISLKDIEVEAGSIIQGEDLSSLLISKINATI